MAGLNSHGGGRAGPPSWPAIAELAARQWGVTRSAFQSDRRKDAALTAAGYRVMRFTYDDVTLEGATVVRRLRR